MEMMTMFYMIYMAAMYVVILVFGVISYILSGKSMSAIARRRGIEKPWLAWVPVGNVWMLGCISDQYRYVVHHQETNRRGKLLVLNIITMACGVVFGVVTALLTSADEDMVTMITLAGTYLILAVAVVQMVVQFKAYYDLFRSCDPEKSLIYLLVSIFTSFPLPFFIYNCRNKDLGMPPRTLEVEVPCE